MATVLLVRHEFRVDEDLVDPTAIVLSDSTAAYGIRKTGGANVIAAGTAMTRISTGVYEYAFTEANGAEYGQAYTSWVTVTYGGVDHYFDEHHAAVSESAYGITFAEIKTRLADYLSWNRSGWDATHTARLEEAIKAGAQQFYWPFPLPGEKIGHRWSFLQPVQDVTTEAGEDEYLLPEDFGGLVDSKMWFAAGDNKWMPLRVGPVGEVLRRRQTDPADGTPSIAAIAPQLSTGMAVQRWLLLIGPGADDEYTLRFRYQVTPEALDSSHVHHLGGAVHSETLVASCLAIAENRYGNQSGEQQKYFLQRLAASVSHDRRLSPGHLGYNADGPGDSIVTKRAEFVTFQGVLYDNR